MTDERLVTVGWYEHDCEWLTKYCDENHRVYAKIPVSVLRQYLAT